MDVVRKVRYDSAFTFRYSRRTGTPAAAMEDQIPVDVVKDRFDRLLAEVQEISREVTARHTHTVQEVLVESINEQDPSLVTGRMSNNTLVHFKGDASLIGTLPRFLLHGNTGGKQLNLSKTKIPDFRFLLLRQVSRIRDFYFYFETPFDSRT